MANLRNEPNGEEKAFFAKRNGSKRLGTAFYATKPMARQHMGLRESSFAFQRFGLSFPAYQDSAQAWKLRGVSAVNGGKEWRKKPGKLLYSCAASRSKTSASIDSTGLLLKA